MAKRTGERLEDKQIRTWIKNNERFDARPDGNGLYLRFRESDKKPIWFLRFKIAKIEQKLILGRYPDMSLKKAREEAMMHRIEIQKGNNPAQAKRENKRTTAAKAIAEKSAQTVSELVDEYFRKNVDGKLKSAHARRLSFNKYLIPAIGKLKIEAVEPRHIAAMLEDIASVTPTTANDILAWCKQLFNYAIKRQIIKNNPAFAFNTSDAGGREKSRDRYLTHEELTILFKAMRDAEKFTRHHYICAKLLLLFGCRKEELLTAKRDEFDLKNAVWHMSPNNKTERPIDIPLTDSTISLLKELLQISIDGSEFLIPSMGVRTKKTGHVDVGYLNKPLKNWVYPLMGVDNFTLHDFRATMRTHLTSKAIGVDRFVAERCLNHKIPGMDGVYDRGDYFEERRTALELWSSFIETCESGKAWNVTPIRKAI